MSAALSVVIPTYNRADLLRRTLDSLVTQRFPADELEVVVSDDGSSDTTAETARSYVDRLNLRYHFQEDLGFRAGAARNAGARLASAPVLAFLDTGSLANPDYARAHLDAHATRCAVMGYTHGANPFGIDATLDQELASLPPAELFDRVTSDKRWFDSREHQFAMVDHDLGRMAAPWFLFWSWNISIRAADFWAVGGFDEDFASWGAEDIELGYRLTEHGVPIALCRAAWTVELPHERSVDNMLSSLRNMQLLLDKHRAPLVEMCAFVLLTGQVMTAEDACRPLLTWTRRARRIDVTAELVEALPDGPQGTVAIFGGGGTLPASWAACTLLDFDAALLARAVDGGRHGGLYAIGLRTGLPDRAFDVVVITSRLRGLWEQWGEHLLEEAHRVGRTVLVPWAAPR